jgi:hypothetical protein
MIEVKKNTRYKILTPNGFEPFLAVRVLHKDEYYVIYFSNKKNIKCATNHKFISNGIEILAKDLKIGDIVDSKLGHVNIIDKVLERGDITLYDLINVGENNIFFSNDIISHNCDFATSGNTVIEPEILKWYEENCIKEPINREGLDRALWVWEYPDPMRYYMVVADVARGDGMDYSTYHVIDVDTLTQVAEYKAQIDTRYFANELISIATKYNRALLVIENANIGWDVIQSVLESGYNNLHYSHRADNSVDFQTYLSVHNGNNTLVPGFTMATKIRLNIIEKMRDFIENKQVVFRSIRLLDELKVFIWKNGKQQAMQGYNDDLVMAFAIAMFLRETSVRYKKTADSLTVSVLNSLGKSTADVGFYNANSLNTQNPWNMKISAQGGEYSQDLTWLIG